MSARILAISRFDRSALLAAMIPVFWISPAGPAYAAAGPLGERVFNQAGCVACHGKNAQGSTFAPPLPGHTVEQVKRYVRNPHGKMPRFGPDKLSDSDLDAIASYIAGLPLPEVRGKRVTIEQSLEIHHWMAHHALRANDPKHATHHLSHVLALVKDNAHRRDIGRLLELVRANRLEEAAHGVVVMVNARVTPETSMEQMHLRLGLGSLEADDAKEVQHHLEHYVESVSPHDRKHAEELLVRLKKGDLGSVRKQMAHLLSKSSMDRK